MSKNCDDCKIRYICEVRRHFGLGKGDDYIKTITGSPNNYATLRTKILNDVSGLCKYAML